jgi:integrase
VSRVRSRGEGSISKRKDGRFEIRLSLGSENGKRKRVFLYAKTRPEAVRLLAGARSQLKPGAQRTPVSETVEHFLTRWLETDIAKTKRESTFRDYEQTCRTYLIPVIGKVRLSELTPEHVDMIVNHATDAGLAIGTVRLVRTIFGASLNRAIKWRIPGVENVVRMTDPPKMRRREMKYLDREQALVFLEAIKGNRLEAFYLTALYCGLRLGELQALRWQDIDLEKAQLRVANSYRYARLGLQEPKTDTSYRPVSLSERVTAALRAHRLRQIAEQAATGEEGIPWLNEWGLVFTGEHGSPTARTTIHDGFKRLLREAGLPEIRFHDLRHTCATLRLAAGVSIKVVSEELGHSRISTTMDLYAHVLPSSRQEAAEALERLLG